MFKHTFSKVGASIGGALGAVASYAIPFFAHAQLFTVPSSTTTLADTGTWSTAVFTALLGIALVGAGILIGGMFASYVLGKIVQGVSKVVGKGKGGGRRGRRR